MAVVSVPTTGRGEVCVCPHTHACVCPCWPRTGQRPVGEGSAGAAPVPAQTPLPCHPHQPQARPGLVAQGGTEDAWWQPGMLMVPGSAWAKFRNPNQEGEWCSPSFRAAAQPPLQPGVGGLLLARALACPPHSALPLPPPPNSWCCEEPSGAVPSLRAGGRPACPGLPSHKGECSGPALPPAPGREDPGEPQTVGDTAWAGRPRGSRHWRPLAAANLAPQDATPTIWGQ